MNLFNNPIMGSIIALILIFALLSILVSILLEWWNSYYNSRGVLLKDSIFSLLKDQKNLDYGYLFYNHHIMGGLTKNKTKTLPQNISAGIFANVLIDIIAQQAKDQVPITRTLSDGKAEFEATGTAATDTLDLFKKAVDSTMNPSPFRDMLQGFLSKGGNTIAGLSTQIEEWFNDQMDNTTATYKKAQRKKAIVAGFIVAISMNVDSIFLFKVLTMDDNLRNGLVDQAEKVADDYAKLTDDQKKDNQKLIGLFEKQKATTDNDSLNTKLDSYINKLKKFNIALSDSQKVRYDQANKVVYLASELGVPIGWDDDYAPISWFMSQTDCDCFTDQKNCPESAKMGKSRFFSKIKDEEGEGSLMAYLDYRNCYWHWDTVLLYLLGIFISGFSLSFGAPFWFDALMRIVKLKKSVEPKK